MLQFDIPSLSKNLVITCSFQNLSVFEYMPEGMARALNFSSTDYTSSVLDKVAAAVEPRDIPEPPPAP